MHALSVILTIKQDKIESFAEVIAGHAARTLEIERACLRFDVGRDPEDPSRFFLYELYENEAAVEAHRDSAHMADFYNTAGDWIEDKEVNGWVVEATS